VDNFSRFTIFELSPAWYAATRARDPEAGSKMHKKVKVYREFGSLNLTGSCRARPASQLDLSTGYPQNIYY